MHSHRESIGHPTHYFGNSRSSFSLNNLCFPATEDRPDKQLPSCGVFRFANYLLHLSCVRVLFRVIACDRMPQCCSPDIPYRMTMKRCGLHIIKIVDALSTKTHGAFAHRPGDSLSNRLRVRCDLCRLRRHRSRIAGCLAPGLSSRLTAQITPTGCSACAVPAKLRLLKSFRRSGGAGRCVLRWDG